MDVFVRPALAVDRNAVQGLLEESMAGEGLMPLREIEFERTWRIANEPGSAFRFMVADAGPLGIVGMMSLHTHFSTYSGRPIIRLEDVVVDREHRGKGVGRALVKFADSFASRIGASRLELTVAKNNKLGRRLYESAGFLMTKYLRYDKTPTPERNEKTRSSDA